MRLLTFTNSRGDSINLDRESGFLFNYIEGLGDVGAAIQLQKAPFQDGSTYIDSSLEDRAITFDVNIFGKDDDDISSKRSLLSNIFNPKLGEGTLTYTYGTTKRSIKAVSQHVPVFPSGLENRRENFQKAMISLVCPTPFWEDMNGEIYKLEDFVGSFKFKFIFPVRFSQRGDSKILVNSGDVPTPVIVEFRGPALNPKVTNLDTGEFIRVNHNLPVGYKLIIDTSFGNKRVEIIAPNNTIINGFHFIDLESSFFDLSVGENRIGFITEGGSPEVYMSYKNRYLSV